jgi:hypothetical protein
MVHKKILDLCRKGESISGELAKDPAIAPFHAGEKLFGIDLGDHVKQELFKDPRKPVSDDELKQALECGNWGPQKPSELFLRVSYSSKP